jgi:cytochrome c-type biogenesis protein CcmH/NrfG
MARQRQLTELHAEAASDFGSGRATTLDRLPEHCRAFRSLVRRGLARLTATGVPAVALASLTVSACTVLPSAAPRTPAPPQRTSPEGAPATRPATPDQGDENRAGAAAPSASSELLAQSRADRAAGRYAAAAVSVERALRIDPNNPALWLELGEIQLAGGNDQQAEMMARKALTLAGGTAHIESRAERLIRAALAVR